VNQDGSISIVMAIFIAVSMIITFALTNMAVFLNDRVRAHNAADASALAAAHALAMFDQDPCSVAKEIAKRNRVELTGCYVGDSYIEVIVEIASRFSITAESRAEVG